MFSISNMFVHTKRHKLTYLSASACISVAPPLCHRRRRHYTPGASLPSKQWTFPRGCKKSYPVLYENEKTAEEHRREDKSPPFPPTHQWGCTKSLPQMWASTCGLKITRNVKKNKIKKIYNTVASDFPCVSSDGWLPEESSRRFKRQRRTLESSAEDSVDPLPVWQLVRPHLSLGHPPTPCPHPPAQHPANSFWTFHGSLLRRLNSTCKLERSFPVFCWLFMRRRGGAADGRPKRFVGVNQRDVRIRGMT